MAMWKLFAKYFYSFTLFRELGITNLQSTNTYDHCKNINHGTVLRKHSDDLLRYFGIYILEDNKRLPSIY